MASGSRGQVVRVAPAKRLVIVETMEGGAVRTPAFLDLARRIVADER